MRKRKKNKTLSSFHASFWRTGFFWAVTLLNLICHSVWLKVCLAPSILLSFTWAPQSRTLDFHPELISSTHPSLALPFISLFSSLPLSRYTHTYGEETKLLLPCRGPDRPWGKRKSSRCFLKLERRNRSSLQSGTKSLQLREQSLCPSSLAACCLQLFILTVSCFFQAAGNSSSVKEADWLPKWTSPRLSPLRCLNTSDPDEWILRLRLSCRVASHLQVENSWWCWGLFYRLFGETVV